MSRKGEAIPNNERNEDIAKSEGENDRPDDLQNSQDSSNKVKPTIGPIGMLGHIEGVELL